MFNKKDEYIYAVARIRCKESKLLSNKNIEQMLSMKDSQSIERFLRDFGWPDPSNQKDILTLEEENLWILMKELTDDLSVFDFLRVQRDFHNLKASVKAVYSDKTAEPLLIKGGIYEPEFLYDCVKNREYNRLPSVLSVATQEAMSVILRTGDTQLCDGLIDKACLSYIAGFAKASENELIKKYCELFVASANIKIAVRCASLKKSADFILELMAECETLDIKVLCSSSTKGFDEICNYLSTTDYKSAVLYIKESLSAFEKWCDNYIMNLMRTQKSEPFSIGPLVAYIIAKQAEIKAVRLILTAKNNSLPDSVIRERICELYV